MEKKKVKCSECEFFSEYRKAGNERSEFSCRHPNADYIRNYFRQHKIRKMEGFIGFGKRLSHEAPIKTSPAWCPKKENKED